MIRASSSPLPPLADVGEVRSWAVRRNGRLPGATLATAPDPSQTPALTCGALLPRDCVAARASTVLDSAKPA